MIKRLLKGLSSLLISVLLIGHLSLAQAQLDPMSTLLINSNSQEPEKEAELDSGRYTVKPTRPPANKVERKTLPAVKQNPGVKEAPDLTDQVKTVDSLVSDRKSEEKKNDNSNVGKQVKDLLMGGSEEELANYNEYVHPDDPRKNLLEVSFAPIYLYNHSGSNYWYRSYFASSPGFQASAKVWFTPFLGFQGSYLTSLGADLRGNLEGSLRVAADHQIYDAGVRFRKFYGFSRKSPVVTFGLDYTDSQLRVPADATNRVGLQTTGVRLSLEISLASAMDQKWIFGMGLSPQADHEEQATAVTVKSGAASETQVAEFWVGKKFEFSRNNTVYWRLNHRIEKTFFEGQTNIVDPISAQNLEGVTVSNGLTVFSFGYTWGD